MRRSAHRLVVASCVVAAGAATAAYGQTAREELPMTPVVMHQLQVSKDGQVLVDTAGMSGQIVEPAPQSPYTPRYGCPQPLTYSSANFGGGQFVLQAGFAQGEIAAASYTLPADRFPIKIDMMEMIFATYTTCNVQTVTEWTVLVWDGPPNTGILVAEFSSDDTILPHMRMGPGAAGVNVQLTVDPADPEQIYVFNNSGTNTFSVGFRIDRHNNPPANPCTTSPPQNSNAFPTSDQINGLSQPTRNWIYALQCGGLACPGGWHPFANYTTLCRPTGDWNIRVTWDPINCDTLPGACCFGTAGCALLPDQQSCNFAGGTWLGGGTLCGQQQNGQFPICVGDPCPPCIADFNQDDSVDDLDITAFIAAFEAGDSCADINGDEGIDDLDFFPFFNAIEQGC